jgi:hypothetical protein
MYMSLCTEPHCYVCCGGVEVYNDGMCVLCCGESWWWGITCTCADAPATRLNVTDLRVKVAFGCSPSRNYLRSHETQHGGRTRANSKSMVSMEDAALPMAQEVACG